MANRLKDHFPIVYTGPGGFVAHECIIDMRDVKEETGIGVEDVAKRLADYGFHAPTMSWPVPETLMIEPTESEGKAELDRFCDAMIAIRAEIAEVEERQGRQGQQCTAQCAPHPPCPAQGLGPALFKREQAYFPLPSQRDDKYWPPVARVDNVYGDRNLVCACPPLEDYMEAAE